MTINLYTCSIRSSPRLAVQNQNHIVLIFPLMKLIDSLVWYLGELCLERDTMLPLLSAKIYSLLEWKLLGRNSVRLLFTILINYLMCIRSDNNLRHAGWILLQHLQHCPLDKLKHQKQFSSSFEKLQQLIIGIFMGLWKVKIFVKIDSHHWTMFSWRRLRSTRSSRMVVRLTSSLSSESLNFLIATISPVSEERGWNI